jgi:uncharacterized iron-regulated protein
MAAAFWWVLTLSGSQASAQSGAELPAGFHWSATELQDHPLVGRLWSSEARGHVPLHTLKEAMSRADFLLLGEVHDNPDAHSLQAWAVAMRASIAPKPAVVFEHIRTNQRDRLAQFAELGRATGRPGTAPDLMRLLDWSESGWPAEEMFSPLFEAVLAADLQIYAGGPAREQVRRAAKGDEGFLSAIERSRLLLDMPMQLELADALTAELRESHCGILPEAALGPMAQAQRYRDAVLADTMLTASSDHGAAILIAGNGHVRSDRGVPWYLRRRAPGKAVVSLMLVEAAADQADAQSYVPQDPAGRPAAEFVLFTPRAKRADPCEAMRRPGKG